MRPPHNGEKRKVLYSVKAGSPPSSSRTGLATFFVPWRSEDSLNCQTFFKFQETPQRVGAYHHISSYIIMALMTSKALCNIEDVSQNMARGNVKTIRMVPSCHLASQSAALTLCPSLGCGHTLKPRSHAARKHAGQSYPVADFAKDWTMRHDETTRLDIRPHDKLHYLNCILPS